MLVWVASYPRSGNTLTTLTLRDAFGIGRLGGYFRRDDLNLDRFAQDLPPKLLEPPWRPPARLRGLPVTDLLDALRREPDLFFVKTHRLSAAEMPDPALYVVRDGRDAIVSQAHQIMNRPHPRWDDLDFDGRVARLIEPGVPAHGSWSVNVARWLNRPAPNAIVRFEALAADPVATVSEACRRIGVRLPEVSGEVPRFPQLQAAAPKLFRRGQIGAWRDEMTPRMQRRFWRFHGDQMRELGYEDE